VIHVRTVRDDVRYRRQTYRLKQLALDERTTVAGLIRDGLNLILKRKTLPPLMLITE
jgi:hypothetical protein